MFKALIGNEAKNLLFVSGHTYHLDSSLAEQNIHEGHPLTTTFLV